MTNEDKRLIIESVGLCWHEWEVVNGLHICECGTPFNPQKISQNQLDPLNPVDMYGKIWVAFKEKEDIYLDFRIWIWTKPVGKEAERLFNMLTSAPDLATAMLEYFKEKRDVKEPPIHRSRYNYQNGCTCGEIFEFVIDLENHLKKETPCTK